MKYSTHDDGLVLPKCPFVGDGIHVGSYMCTKCSNFISRDDTNVVCKAENAPISEQVERDVKDK